MGEKSEIISKRGRLLSPVEERHIDFILEEEFSVNPDFLDFFLDRARQGASDTNRIPECAKHKECTAVRSVSTAEGETDLLVMYNSDFEALPTAILIENKIRARFQPDQPARYRKRGDEGKGDKWSGYWTCLVAHTKYTSEKGDFDAVVSLESLLDFFAARPDKRSRFRAEVLAQMIEKYEATGIQRIDEGMTRFRASYASECARVFKPGQWIYDKARDAWWDDSWFFFRGASWPKDVQIRHQARTGCVDLILPIPEDTPLRLMEKQWLSQPSHGLRRKISVIPIGKNKHAIQTCVPRVLDFSSGAPSPEFGEFFAAIEFLAELYKECSPLLPEHLRE